MGQKFNTTFSKGVFHLIDWVSYPLNNAGRVHRKSVKIEKDIVYDTKLEKVCKLDLYSVPDAPTDKKLPVLFYIHGGGFVGGDKKYRVALCSWFAKMGMVCVSVNYGLAPEFRFPSPLEHIITALNWVYANSDALNLDLDKVIISGDSAGGYYAAMVSAIANNKKFSERMNMSTPIKARATVLNCGLYDVETALGGKIIFDMGQKIGVDYFGFDIEKLPEYEQYDCISPINWIDENFPESYVIHSQKDVFCSGHGDTLIKKLEQYNIPYKSFKATKLISNHCFSLFWDMKDSKLCNKEVEEFIKNIINE